MFFTFQCQNPSFLSRSDPPDPSKMSGSSRRSARSRAVSSSAASADAETRNPTTRTRRDMHRGRGPIRLMEVNLKSLLGFGFLALLIVVFLIYDRTASVVVEDRSLRIVTPLPAPKMMDLPQVGGFDCCSWIDIFLFLLEMIYCTVSGLSSSWIFYAWESWFYWSMVFV